MSSPGAEIITIGTELLLGTIVDTNTSVIAGALRKSGVSLYRTATVGDNPERIAQAVRESLSRVQAVITTGGLGPTIDDPTREAIAKAFGVTTRFEPALWEQIQERFAGFGRVPGENNRRQAFLPVGAVPIENPVGTAPAFYFETPDAVVISLPGVPSEMAYLLEHAVVPYLKTRFHMDEVLEALTIRTAGLGESTIDERIQQLETLTNPTVGVSAHPGRVDIRITARAESSEAARQQLEDVGEQVRGLLGEAIYGEDADTLEEALLSKIEARGWRLATVEAGTQAELARGLSEAGGAFVGGRVLPVSATSDEVQAALEAFIGETGAEAGLGLHVWAGPQAHVTTRIVIIEGQVDRHEREVQGPAVNVVERSVSLALDHLRRRF